MTILNLISDANTNINLLMTPCQEWDFANPPVTDTLQFVKDMIDTMYHYDGVGLASNQVGCLFRMFVMRGTNVEGDLACFNPRIVHFSEEKVLLEESCLSWPGLVVKVKRPKHIRLRFTIPYANGTQMFTRQFTGITARCVQHEIDHLNGKLWFAQANKYHRDHGFKHRGKYVRENQKSFSSPFQDFNFQKLASS
jgi:peptide deformylase